MRVIGFSWWFLALCGVCCLCCIIFMVNFCNFDPVFFLRCGIKLSQVSLFPLYIGQSTANTLNQYTLLLIKKKKNNGYSDEELVGCTALIAVWYRNIRDKGRHMRLTSRVLNHRCECVVVTIAFQLLRSDSANCGMQSQPDAVARCCDSIT